LNVAVAVAAFDALIVVVFVDVVAAPAPTVKTAVTDAVEPAAREPRPVQAMPTTDVAVAPEPPPPVKPMAGAEV
jgi:hypothetical protein